MSPAAASASASAPEPAPTTSWPRGASTASSRRMFWARSSTTRIRGAARSCPRAPVEQLRDLARELAHADRLLEVAVEARPRAKRARSSSIANAVSATTGDPLGRRVGAQPRQRLDPVHARQLDVHQHEVGRVRAGQRRSPSSAVAASSVRWPACSSRSRTSLRLRGLSSTIRTSGHRVGLLLAGVRAAEPPDELDEPRPVEPPLLGEVADAAGQPVAVGAGHLLVRRGR